jgi:hypothetical protein
MEGMWLVSYIALWMLLLALGVVVVSLLRNVGLLATTVQQIQTGVEDTLTLGVGAPVPELPLKTLSGQATSLAAHRGTPAVLVFVSPGCGPCHELLVARQHGAPLLTDLPPATQPILVSLGDGAATQSLLSEVPFADGVTLLADPTLVRERWGVHSTPTIVLLDTEGRYLRHQLGFNAPPVGQDALKRRQDIATQA